MAINPAQFQGAGPIMTRQFVGPDLGPATVGAPGGAPGEVPGKLASAQLGDGWRNVAGVNPVQTVQKGEAGGLDPDKKLSDLKPEELARLGGDTTTLQRLAKTSPSPTVSQVRPLMDRPEALTSIADVMERRPDLQWGDLVSRDQDGKVQVDPSLFDDRSKQLVMDRNDIKPAELSTMRANFTKWLKNPASAKEAYDSALDLMKTRTDLRPDAVSQMMGRMITSVGGTNGQQGAANGASAVDMFKKAANLMKNRTDVDPSSMGKLAEEMGKLGGKQDPNAANQVAHGFDRATQALATRPDLKVDDAIGVAQTMKKHFPGDDASSGADRMAAFDKGMNMVSNNPQVDGKGLATMMDRAAGDGRRGAKLLNALDTMESGINSGRARAEVLTDPNARQQPDQALRDGDIRLDRQGREDRSRPQPGTQPGRPGVTPGGREAGGREQRPPGAGPPVAPPAGAP